MNLPIFALFTCKSSIPIMACLSHRKQKVTCPSLLSLGTFLLIDGYSALVLIFLPQGSHLIINLKEATTQARPVLVRPLNDTSLTEGVRTTNMYEKAFEQEPLVETHWHGETKAYGIAL